MADGQPPESSPGPGSTWTGCASRCSSNNPPRTTPGWITLHEVEHGNDRVRRLEEAIGEAVKLAPPQMREVIQALQALRGIAQISAVTIVSEFGQISRFAGARQLMGYSGAVLSEDSSGKRVQR